MWVDGSTDYLSNARSDRRPDTLRDTDPNAFIFGEPVAERERLTKSDRGSLR